MQRASRLLATGLVRLDFQLEEGVEDGILERTYKITIEVLAKFLRASKFPGFLARVKA